MPRRDRLVKLAEFGLNLWTADGPPVCAFGPIKLPTRMVVVKLRDGSLWVNSPIDVRPHEMHQLDDLGPVRHLVAPSPLHVWRLQEWKRSYPNARVWEPRRKSRREFDVILDDAPPEWARDMDQVIFRGNAFVEEVEFFHPASRTLIFTDFIQNYSGSGAGLLTRLLLRFAGIYGGGVPLDIRMTFVRRMQARESLGKLLSWDFDKLVIAHGNCISHDAKDFVVRAFRWLITSPR